ncbi:MAG: ECF transporter S component [Bacteroidales bacterium]
MYAAGRFYSLSYQDTKTYLFSLLFIAGNILLPQLCHLFHLGGVIWLPIFFFTLIGAYKYGIWVGLLTAVLSPVINSVAFGMPPAVILPEMILKSALLAMGAAYVAKQTKKVSFIGILLCILGYQMIGSGVEMLAGADPAHILNSLKLGIPGMTVQLLGGFGLLKLIQKI